jgi:hypothetical protein
MTGKTEVSLLFVYVLASGRLLLIASYRFTLLAA